MYYRFLLIFLFLSVAIQADAQDCAPLADAQLKVSLPVGMDGTNYRSGVAFHPDFDTYYSVNSGLSGYPIEAFSEAGTLLATSTQAFNFQGLWFNPVINGIEGNGFDNEGIFTHDLDATGLPMGTGTVRFTINQPTSRSVGDMDVADSLYIYYYNGSIFRYNSTDNSALDTMNITNLPVSIGFLNLRSIVYVGCAEREYGVYDYVTKKLYYINKATGAYNGETKLPADAPLAQESQMSYANNRLFLYDIPSRTWKGYQVVDAATSAQNRDRLDVNFSVFPNPSSEGFYLRVAGNTTDRLTAEVYDVFGRLLITRAYTPGLRLDLQDLPAGTYFARLRNEVTNRVSGAKVLTKN
jgi:hypothetical protein